MLWPAVEKCERGSVNFHWKVFDLSDGSIDNTCCLRYIR